MFKFVTKFLQCSALTIALAFLICPDFNWVYAQPETEENSEAFNQLLEDYRDLMNEMMPPVDDESSHSEIETFWWGPDQDGDGISDKRDVCIEDSYKYDYHKDCLTQAGVKLPNTLKLESDILGTYPPSYTGPRISVPITVWTFRTARLKTCDDLKDFRDKMWRISKRWQNWGADLALGGAIVALIVALITLGTGWVITAAVLSVLSLICQRIARYYQGLGDAARFAHEDLCIDMRR